jgi:hypothetical protein
MALHDVLETKGVSNNLPKGLKIYVIEIKAFNGFFGGEGLQKKTIQNWDNFF